MARAGRRFFPRSLRWRLQLWMAFLLLCVLTGFGAAVYQLQRVNRFNQIDGELETRISALTGALRELYVEQGPSRGAPPPDAKSSAAPKRPPPPQGASDNDGSSGNPPSDLKFAAHRNALRRHAAVTTTAISAACLLI